MPKKINYTLADFEEIRSNLLNIEYAKESYYAWICDCDEWRNIHKAQKISA